MNDQFPFINIAAVHSQCEKKVQQRKKKERENLACEPMSIEQRARIHFQYYIYFIQFCDRLSVSIPCAVLQMHFLSFIRYVVSCVRFFSLFSF